MSKKKLPYPFFPMKHGNNDTPCFVNVNYIVSIEQDGIHWNVTTSTQLEDVGERWSEWFYIGNHKWSEFQEFLISKGQGGENED